MKTSTSSSSERAEGLWPTLVATAVAVLLGCVALYNVTLGVRVVSTEDGRRLAIEEAPRSVPFATLDLPGRPMLNQVLKSDGRVTVVSFIYASCNSICRVQGSEFQQMQEKIKALGLQNKVRLLSISFDPRDTQAKLTAFASREHADSQIWRVSGIASASERKDVLDTFGIVVVPAPLDEFIHNAAFHIVDPDGRLAKIDDFDQPDQTLADAVSIFNAGRP